jgi:ferritin-like metal-binding protein YciE
LYFLELGELLWVERTLAFDALPKLIGEVQDAELREALEEHLAQTKEHVTRVEQAFRASGAEPTAARSAALASSLEQHESQEVKEPTLGDVFHASGAARTEHLELGLYDAVLLLAEGDAASLLQQNRKDEEAALKRVEKIAERLTGDLPR